MRIAAFIWLMLVSASLAQNIIMKDGKVISGKGLRRQGDTIMVTIELPGEGGQSTSTGEVGYPLSQILKLDFPEPPQLIAARELLVQGKLTEAIAQLDPVVAYYQGFRDAPGSWWSEAALLKARALISAGKDKEAEPIAQQVARYSSNPETARAAEMQLAAGMIRRAQFAPALELAERAQKESKVSGTLAAAGIVKGECLLAAKNWEDAILSFLQVPVLYPGEKTLVPPAMLGAGRALFGMEDFARAKATLNDLLKNYATAPESADAKLELEKITAREKALADPSS